MNYTLIYSVQFLLIPLSLTPKSCLLALLRGSHVDLGKVCLDLHQHHHHHVHDGSFKDIQTILYMEVSSVAPVTPNQTSLLALPGLTMSVHHQPLLIPNVLQAVFYFFSKIFLIQDDQPLVDHSVSSWVRSSPFVFSIGVTSGPITSSLLKLSALMLYYASLCFLKLFSQGGRTPTHSALTQIPPNRKIRINQPLAMP